MVCESEFIFLPHHMTVCIQKQALPIRIQNTEVKPYIITVFDKKKISFVVCVHLSLMLGDVKYILFRPEPSLSLRHDPPVNIQSNIYRTLPKVNQVICTLDTICMPKITVLAQAVLEIFCSQVSIGLPCAQLCLNQK